MPTDEQRMRNEFEEIRVAEYDIGSVDIDPETGEYTRRSTYEAWGHFQAGWAARDAEVQALREALTYALHVLECLKVDNPNPLLPNARWKSVDMARAALEQEAAE